MTTADELSNTLEEFGFEVSEDIIEKCLDLCISYNVSSAREFVEIYVAFSINHLDGAEPTLSALDDLERKELANYKKKAHEAKSINTHQNLDGFGDYDDDGDDDEVMGAYICTTPKTNKANKRSIVSTPIQNEIVTSTSALESPGSYAKDVPGKVVCTFGGTSTIKSIDWRNDKRQTIKIEPFTDPNGNGENAGILSNEQDFMYDNMQQKCQIAADRIYDIGLEICKRLIKERPNEYSSDLLQNTAHVDEANQTTIKCIGRVCSDNDFNLDKNSTLLIGADEIKLRTVKLNFNRLKSFSLFPGQTVLVTGLNPRGDTLFADEIVGERQLTCANGLKLKEQLSVVMATGPFTLAGDLKYEPMHELLAYCNQHKPDVLILLGPFVDADHQLIADCSSKLSFETMFENMVATIANTIGPDTEILIVSSSRDAHSTTVFPTHPYKVDASYRNVTFLPDPSIIKVNGVTIALTSTDIYNHILDVEIALNAGDKVKRICSYLFNQKSFYPLTPSSNKLSLDSRLTHQFAALPVVPDLFILSSTAKYFIRDVNNCLVVNPGQLADNSSRGTFGRLTILPSNDQKPLNSIVGCQIIKV